jgi:signal transduction histidine kinase
VIHDLVQGIADEIGNPLLFASGYLQLLAISVDRSTDAETAEKLDLVRIGIDRIARSIEKLRLLSGTLKPVVSRRDPLPLVTAAVEKARPKALLREIQLAWEGRAPGPGIELMLDPERFSLALHSVLRAGIDIADQGATIAISARTERGRLVLRFGIPAAGCLEADPGRLFEPYALAAQMRGAESGLDLAIARTIMAAHGAQSRSYREADDVLVLEFFLPLAAPDATERIPR